MDQFTVTAKNQKLQAIASTDSTRYNLQGVYFNQTHVAATDGYRLVVAKKDKEENLSDVIVQFGNAKQKTASKALTSESYVRVNNGNNAVGILNVGNSAEILHGSTFPGYRCILAGVENNKTSITLNAEYLLSIAKVLADGKETSITLTIGAPKDAVLITGARKDAFGLIMPITPGYDVHDAALKIFADVKGE